MPSWSSWTGGPGIGPSSNRSHWNRRASESHRPEFWGLIPNCAQLGLRWNQLCPSLRREEPLYDVVPYFIIFAFRIETTQIQDANELKADRVSIRVLVVGLRLLASTFRLSKCRTTGRSVEQHDSLLANTTFPGVAVNRDPELEQQFGGVSLHRVQLSNQIPPTEEARAMSGWAWLDPGRGASAWIGLMGRASGGQKWDRSPISLFLFPLPG